MQFSILIFTYAVLLIIDGLLCQILAEQKNPALLTPAIFGGILIFMGIMSLKNDLELYGKHGAAALSLIAFIYSINNFAELFRENFTHHFYVNTANSIMSFLSILFLILAVIQFGKERNKPPEKN